MKPNRSFLHLSVLAVIVLAASSVFACGGHGKGCCDGEGMTWKQDAKFEIVNLDKGVKVTVTSTNADAVKAIQDHIADCSGSCCSKCSKKSGMAWKKDAKFESSKLDNGMVLTVTTDTADAVKDLQAHFVDMGSCRHAQEKHGKRDGHHGGHGCQRHGQS